MDLQELIQRREQLLAARDAIKAELKDVNQLIAALEDERDEKELNAIGLSRFDVYRLKSGWIAWYQSQVGDRQPIDYSLNDARIQLTRTEGPGVVRFYVHVGYGTHITGTMAIEFLEKLPRPPMLAGRYDM